MLRKKKIVERANIKIPDFGRPAYPHLQTLQHQAALLINHYEASVQYGNVLRAAIHAESPCTLQKKIFEQTANCFVMGIL